MPYPALTLCLCWLAQGASDSDLLADRDRQLEADRSILVPFVSGLREPRPTRLVALQAELMPARPDSSAIFEPLPEMEPIGNSRPGDSPLGQSAKAWYDLSLRAIEAKRFALADDLLRRSLRRDPDDPEVRRLLGFLKGRASWATPEAARNRKAGKVLHPRFGWVPESWVSELDSGNLPASISAGGDTTPRWIPAAEADAARAIDIDRAWKVETPHFTIRANIPLDEAITIGRSLESFHQLFLGRLADVIGPDRLPLAARSRTSTAQPIATSITHLVDYFATKQAYVDYLAPTEGPSIGETLGLYIPVDAARRRGQSARSSFHDDPEGRIALEATLYHEVSHQLLFELSGTSRHERNVGHYWLFEGLGTYFETVRSTPDGLLLVGGLYGPRMAEARERCLNRNEFLPIREFVRLNKTNFTQGEAVRAHYAQGIALANFLMDADGGTYREAFLTYVADAYRGRLRDDAGRSLDDRIGLSFEEIDAGLRAYLAGPPPKAEPPSP